MVKKKSGQHLGTQEEICPVIQQVDEVFDNYSSETTLCPQEALKHAIVNAITELGIQHDDSGIVEADLAMDDCPGDAVVENSKTETVSAGNNMEEDNGTSRRCYFQ